MWKKPSIYYLNWYLMSMVLSLLGCHHRGQLRDSCEIGTSSHKSKMGHTQTTPPSQTMQHL